MTLVDELVRRSRSLSQLPELFDPDTRSFLRRRAGLTQAVCAEGFGVARATFTRWERGTRTPQGEHRRIYAELLERLAKEVA